MIRSAVYSCATPLARRALGRRGGLPSIARGPVTYPDRQPPYWPRYARRNWSTTHSSSLALLTTARGSCGSQSVHTFFKQMDLGRDRGLGESCASLRSTMVQRMPTSASYSCDCGQTASFAVHASDRGSNLGLEAWFVSAVGASAHLSFPDCRERVGEEGRRRKCGV